MKVFRLSRCTFKYFAKTGLIEVECVSQTKKWFYDTAIRQSDSKSKLLTHGSRIYIWNLGTVFMATNQDQTGLMAQPEKPNPF